jgi:hypothetical protein
MMVDEFDPSMMKRPIQRRCCENPEDRAPNLVAVATADAEE